MNCVILFHHRKSPAECANNVFHREKHNKSKWKKTKNKPTKKKNDTITVIFLDGFPKTVIKLLVFTHLSLSQPGPVTRHLVLSAERPVLLVSKISHQQEPLCGTRQKEADRSPELSHYGPQTAEDNRNRLKLCWTIAFEWGYWTLKALLTMEKPLNALHQARTSTVHFVPKKNPPSPPDNMHTPPPPTHVTGCEVNWYYWYTLSEVTHLTIQSQTFFSPNI